MTQILFSFFVFVYIVSAVAAFIDYSFERVEKIGQDKLLFFVVLAIMRSATYGWLLYIWKKFSK